MTEQDRQDQDAKQGGQPQEVPDNVKRDRQGEPYASSQDGVVTYASGTNTNTETGQTTGYVESTDHIPDPTAMSGTLETSGTGGGHHERLTGTTRIFGDIEQVVGKVEAVVQDHLGQIVQEVGGLLKREATQAQADALPQQTVENGGVPEHGGNIVLPNNDTGAAQDAPRSPNVAADAGDVDGGITQVPEGGQGDSYNQQVIAGASNPQEQSDKAKAAEAKADQQTGDTDTSDGKAQESQASTKSAPAKKTASARTAKKTASADDAKK